MREGKESWMTFQLETLGKNTKIVRGIGEMVAGWDGTSNCRDFFLNESLDVVYTGSCTSTACQFRARVVSSLLSALLCSASYALLRDSHYPLHN